MGVRRLRGLALLATLYVVAAVLLAGLTLAAIASFSYTLSTDAGFQALAFEAANTGVYHCVANFAASPTWGQAAGTVEGLARGYTPGPNPSGSPAFYGNLTPAGQDYYVTFDRTSPWLTQYGLRVSMNNLSGRQPVNDPVDGVVVAPNTAHLYVLGLAGQGTLQRRRMLEVVLQFPPMQWAVAASHAILCNAQISGQPASLVVTGQSGLGGQTADDLTAGILALNQGATSEPYSISLDSGSAIYGAVRSLGENSPDPIAVYSPGQGSNPAPAPWAESLETAEPTTDVLPDIDISTYNNYAFANTRIAGDATDSNFTTAPYTYQDAQGVTQTINAYYLSGQVYVGGNLTLGDAPRVTYTSRPCGTPVVTASSGAVPVILNNATVYVQGHFVDTGGLLGVGTVFTKGPQQVALGMDADQAHNWLTSYGIQTSTLGPSTLAGMGIALFADGSLDVGPVNTGGNGQGLSQATILGTLYSHQTITVHAGIQLLVGSIVSQSSDAPANANVVFTGPTEVAYWPEFSQFGSVFAQNNMQGSLLSPHGNNSSLMRILYWSDAP